LAEGVDTETWLFHLRRGDYAVWFEKMIKDSDLANAARQVEQTSDVATGRAQIRKAIEERYTASA
jgi:hypothetical protein